MSPPQTNTMKIITHHICPPIPNLSHDWLAYYAGDEDGLKGWGRTEEEAIKDLEVIPSTIENIRTVLLHLNSSNWGGWKLPKMSISYSAAQFDCDGVQASTMKLDSAVEGSKMFKVGGKNGHLSKYTRL